MLKKISLIAFLLFIKTSYAQTTYFPPTSGQVWDTVSIESLNWCRDKTKPLYDFLESRNSKAFLVLKDGKIVIEKYFGKFTKDSIWYWASAGKTLTAFAIGLAQEDGFLKITDTSSKYLGEGWTNCPLRKENLITIKNQLSMTSGLDDGISDNHCYLDTCLIYKADAGTRWAYHNAPYTMLDKVIENSSGKNLNSYLTGKLKTTTGITGLFIKLGYDNVYFSTPRAMARFGLLMLNKGEWDGTKVMKDQTYYNQMINTSQNLNNSYGYLWWLNGKSNFMVPGLQFSFPGYLSPNSPADMYSALGKNGQFLNVIPSEKLIVIRMGNAPDGNEVPFLMNDTMMLKLKAVMCKSSYVKTTINAEKKFIIYPNPTSDWVSITNESKDLSISSITLSDLQGKQIINQSYSITNFNQRIDLSELLNGFYLIEVKAENGFVQRHYLIKK